MGNLFETLQSYNPWRQNRTDPIPTEGSSTDPGQSLSNSSTRVATHLSNNNKCYNAMITHHSKLVAAVTTEYLTLAGVLLSHEFISNEIHAEMLLPSSTPNKKATILVTAVTERIKIAPQQFLELMKIFSEHTSTKCMVELLQHSANQGEIMSCKGLIIDIIYMHMHYAVYNIYGLM